MRYWRRMPLLFQYGLMGSTTLWGIYFRMVCVLVIEPRKGSSAYSLKLWLCGTESGMLLGTLDGGIGRR